MELVSELVQPKVNLGARMTNFRIVLKSDLTTHTISISSAHVFLYQPLVLVCYNLFKKIKTREIRSGDSTHNACPSHAHTL